MRLARHFFNSKLSIKIVVYYLMIFLLLATLFIFTFVRLNNGESLKTVYKMSADAVASINSNLNFMISTVNSQSKMLLSSDTLQKTLSNTNPDSLRSNPKQMNNYLAEFTNFCEAVSSIYIFDNYGHNYCVDNISYKDISLDKLQRLDWYNGMVEEKGGYVLKLNAGGACAVSSGEKNFVSMIRVINDLNTQEPIGIMIINISEDYIALSLGEAAQTNGTHILLSDEKNREVLRVGDAVSEDMGSMLKQGGFHKDPQVEVLSNTQFVISSLKNQYNWSVATATPIDEFAKQSQTYNFFALLSTLIFISLFVMALIFISLFVTGPIKKLAQAMNDVKSGKFEEVTIPTGADEIGMLKDDYNLMIREIRMLLNNIIREQDEKRKMELEVLQAQIKPHFLYNSFDAISSLSLSGNNKDVYTLVKALGRFYRSFLNSNSEEISLGQELEIVEQYITIQQIRFPNKFTVNWEIDAGTKDQTIPRLTLQPIVENSIKHGIRSQSGQGEITIGALTREDGVELSIRDTGRGMDEATRLQLLSGESSGAGVKITRERLRLYFRAPVEFTISSAEGKGTTVRIVIPKSRKGLESE
ncbi:MAG: sensor histidine kinase [Acetanaerobacterium sp.]